MNACETLIVPNCTVAPDGEFPLCDHYEAGADDICLHYLLVPTDLGDFHRCGCRMAIEESVYSYCGEEPCEDPVSDLTEHEDFSHDGDFACREGSDE